MKLRVNHLLFVLLAAALSACGGGGGADAPSGGGEAPPSATVRVGGKVSGLGAGKYITVGARTAITLTADGLYSEERLRGDSYYFRILTQPNRQICSFTRDFDGTANADITDLDVVCLDWGVPGRLVRGVISGMGTGSIAILQLQAGSLVSEAELNRDGGFRFSVPVSGAYNVKVLSQPAGLVCTVVDGQGSIEEPSGQNADVKVNCAAPTR